MSYFSKICYFYTSIMCHRGDNPNIPSNKTDLYCQTKNNRYKNEFSNVLQLSK